MSAHLTEEEQVENLKRLWREYGTALLTGVLIALTVLYGYRFYQNREERITNEASALYQTLLTTAGNAKVVDAEQLTAIASNLKENYTKTPYSTLAAMIVAANQAQANKLDEAEANLQWAITNTRDRGLGAIATVRLARVQLANNKATKALTTINNLADGELYSMLVENAKGDIYVQLGEKDKARAAYTKAVAALGNDEQAKLFIQMKLDDLGQVTGEQG